MLYAGEFIDNESENYYLRSRYYDPTVGRFTQQDRFLGVDDNPLSLNRYTYCHNNPITFVDPSGHNEYIYNIGNVKLGYAGGQIKSSEDDIKFGRYVYMAEQGQISPQELISLAAAMGVDVYVVGGHIGRGSSGNIPAETLQITFGEQLSYEDSIKAASLFDSYSEGILNEEGLKQQLNELSAMAIKTHEIGLACYDKGTYETAGVPTYYVIDNEEMYPLDLLSELSSEIWSLKSDAPGRSILWQWLFGDGSE